MTPISVLSWIRFNRSAKWLNPLAACCNRWHANVSKQTTIPTNGTLKALPIKHQQWRHTSSDEVTPTASSSIEREKKKLCEQPRARHNRMLCSQQAIYYRSVDSQHLNASYAKRSLQHNIFKREILWILCGEDKNVVRTSSDATDRHTIYGFMIGSNENSFNFHTKSIG